MTATKPSWRDVIKIHPCAAVFPEATAEGLMELRKSIREVGLRQKVTLWRDGKEYSLLDGRSRLDALEAEGDTVIEDAKIKKEYVEETINSLSTRSAAYWVLAANIARRHLTPKQRAALAVKVFAADKAAVNGTIGKEFPMVGDGRGSAPKKKGVRGSVKGDVAAIADAAKVSKPTARKAIREARGEQPKPKRKPPSGKHGRWNILRRQHPDLYTKAKADVMARLKLAGDDGEPTSTGSNPRDRCLDTVRRALVDYQNDPQAGRKGKPGPSERKNISFEIDHLLREFKKGGLLPAKPRPVPVAVPAHAAQPKAARTAVAP